MLKKLPFVVMTKGARFISGKVGYRKDLLSVPVLANPQSCNQNLHEAD